MQKQIMHELHIQPVIDPKTEIKNRIHFLKEYVLKTNAKGYVLGISGGQDSSLAGRLAQMAVEELREEGYDAKFIAVRLPYGVQQDEEDARKALQFIQADQEFIFNISKAVDAVKTEYDDRKKGEALSDY